MSAIEQLRTLTSSPPALGPTSPAGDNFVLLRHALYERHFGPSLWSTLPATDPGMQRYTDTLRGEIAKFQAHHGLALTGDCDAQTWAALAGYDAATWKPATAILNTPSLQDRHVANLHNTDFRHKAYKVGRSLASPACGAVASQYYIALGVLHETLAWAQDLADYLEAHGCKRIEDLHQIQTGDLVVCADLNGNGATDHVTHCFEPRNNTTFLAVDNYFKEAYIRNLLKGVSPHKAHAKYLLRLPD
jgi:hypothetical protein